MTNVTYNDLDCCHAVLDPLDRWACQCHGASIKLVKAGLWDECRVARGSCPGVGGQHSWVVLGMDCYDLEATIIDPTLWSYRDDIEGIWTGIADDLGHRAHGHGSIWAWGQPQSGPGERVVLAPRKPLSNLARSFLKLIGPMDRQGWAEMATYAPVEGWPAGEILAAIEDTLPGVVPIDRLGMLTDRNPNGLYLP